MNVCAYVYCMRVCVCVCVCAPKHCSAWASGDRASAGGVAGAGGASAGAAGVDGDRVDDGGAGGGVWLRPVSQMLRPECGRLFLTRHFLSMEKKHLTFYFLLSGLHVEPRRAIEGWSICVRVCLCAEKYILVCVCVCVCVCMCGPVCVVPSCEGLGESQ